DLRQMTSVLRFDLDNSGYFRVIQNSAVVDRLSREDIAKGRVSLGSWSAIGAELLVKVNCAKSGKKIKLTCAIYDLKNRRSIFSKKISGSNSNRRYLIHRLADAIVEEFTGEKGIAATKIAFTADRGIAGKKDIYLVDYDGAALTRITHDDVVSVVPEFSPDGKTIYYTSYLKGYPKIVSIDLKTGKREVVSSFPGLNAFPAISPDGKEIALSLSKDGTVDIYRMRLDGGKPIRLTRSPGGVASSPCWSPDGKKIAFVSNAHGTAQIYVMDRDGKNKKHLSKGYSYATAVDWSPKGNLIAFTAKRGRQRQIFILDLKNNRVEQITRVPANHANPSFARD
ncbi:unnamed protein product, partial [marine sediment metagenome]